MALDVEDMIPGRYLLEVSSPGLDRLFFDPEQMVPYVGQIVDVTMDEARGRPTPFQGDAGISAGRGDHAAGR